MKVYLSAGEESGDLHGAHLVRELKSRLPEAAFAGMGGARMRDEGFATLVSAEGHNVVGFFEVFGRLAQFRRDLNALARAMVADGARALVAIDYGGFNARLVARAKRAGLKTFYYIPPKLWAWGKGRGARLARDLMVHIDVVNARRNSWPLRLARQREHLLGDDVALHLA